MLVNSTTERRSLVLVVDDEPTIQVLLASVIQRLGFTALCVDDGAAAIAAVEVHRDMLLCVIMDIMMPVLNGVDAAHAIQAAAPVLPIVLMSGAVPETYIHQIAHLRLAGVLRKPFPIAAVRDLLLQLASDATMLDKEERYER